MADKTPGQIAYETFHKGAAYFGEHNTWEQLESFYRHPWEAAAAAIRDAALEEAARQVYGNEDTFGEIVERIRASKRTT